MDKNIDKTIKLKTKNTEREKFYIEIINEISDELVNIIKSQNLIDIRTPSFLNARLLVSKKNNLVQLNRRLQDIDTIDGVFVQEFNNKYVLLKLRYLGKLDKIINQLEKKNITLKLLDELMEFNIKK